MTRRHSEVVIIGGGVIGLSCAYFLARTGKHVQVIEKDKIGQGASFGNCGLITPSHAEPTCKPGRIKSALKQLFDSSAGFRVNPGLDMERWRWLWEFSRNCRPNRTDDIRKAKARLLASSRSLTEKLVKLESLDCNWKDAGLISVCRTDAGHEELLQLSQHLQQVEVPCTMLERDSLLAREPSLNEDVQAGLLFPRDAWLDPYRYTTELAAACRNKQVQIQEDCEIEAIHASDGTIESVYTRLGDFTADQYLVTAGVWSGKMMNDLKLNCPIQPGKGYSITSRMPETRPSHGLILHEANMAVTTWNDSFRLGGTMEIAGFDDSMNKKRIDNLINGAYLYLRDHIGVGVPQTWFGFRPMTPDDLPIIGKPKEWNNMILATGHNMLGMSMSAATGRLVAELATGRKPHIDPSPYHPDRFN